MLVIMYPKIGRACPRDVASNGAFGIAPYDSAMEIATGIARGSPLTRRQCTTRLALPMCSRSDRQTRHRWQISSGVRRLVACRFQPRIRS
eukprot:COSAG03_NODE_946_length_5235_cov_80.053933_9_plen_90_part_00